jgi:hypothetical protein
MYFFGQSLWPVGFLSFLIGYRAEVGLDVDWAKLTRCMG